MFSTSVWRYGNRKFFPWVLLNDGSAQATWLTAQEDSFPVLLYLHLVDEESTTSLASL